MVFRQNDHKTVGASDVSSKGVRDGSDSPVFRIVTEESVCGQLVGRLKTRTCGHGYCCACGVDGLSCDLFIGFP